MRTSVVFSIFLMVCTVWVTAQVTDDRSKYIGYKYKAVNSETVLPNGVKHLGGGLVSDRNVEPVIHVSEIAKGRTRMLWLEVSTGSNEKVITGWEVKDVLVFPNFTTGQHLFYSMDPTIECRRNGKGVVNLVAIGSLSRRRGFRPQRAWLADVKAGKFQPISMIDLKCEYSEP